MTCLSLSLKGSHRILRWHYCLSLVFYYYHFRIFYQRVTVLDFDSRTTTVLTVSSAYWNYKNLLELNQNHHDEVIQISIIFDFIRGKFNIFNQSYLKLSKL